MIISDLNHFEEVVSETANIVGGEDASTLPQQLLADLFASLDAFNFNSPLQITITTASITTPTGGNATVTAGTISGGTQTVGAFAASSASA